MKHIFIIIFSVFFVFITVQAHAIPYTFEWTGTVTSIKDVYGFDSTLAGVSVDDTFLASVTYDPSLFGSGVAIISGDGLDYAAPAGLQMTYQFLTGGIYTQDINHVRARDYDQWNWSAADYILFQVNDHSDTSFTSPLPTSFEAMHTLFLSSISNFAIPSILDFQTNYYDPTNNRIVTFENQEFSITAAAPVPEPATVLLLGTGLVGLVGFRKKFKK